ncbi:hypothetical protein O3G_MSEX012552 [Manduca sexta]|uniref:Peptidoglycan recognition protein n=1 Tax=Manduca sexta TaxID=7130 RepID=A0A921ZPA5_MANSE|nr:hypothetical protein O3G_MSEX012552 [Manduca sexta]KAG6461324.1 hypothetical protein O3G_MSEX012552 [Manduca sexta]
MMLRNRKMALEESSNHSGDNLGIKVKGDLGDFQIIEEKSDSDGEEVFEDNRSRSMGCMSKLPPGFIHPSTSPKINSVIVKDSDNVQFGNNTHFHGPVTIKQVIRNSEFDNSAYLKTETEIVNPVSHKQDSSNDVSASRRFKFQAWHKITLSALCLAIIAGICAVLSIILSDSTRDDKTTTYFKDDETKCILVADPSYHATHKIVTITISLFIVVLLTHFVMHIKLFNADLEVKETGDPLLIAQDHLRIVSRTDWLAQPVEKKLDDMKHPVPWVVITHTATEECSSQSECVLRVRLIQTFHIESKQWFDIGYNFLVGGDGSAYYGRGWDYVGAHTLGYNSVSIGIAFIGTFNTKRPPKKQLEACQKLINRGVKMGKLAKDYKLFAHRQLASTLSPGDMLYNIIKTWPHFAQNFTDPKEMVSKT